MTPPLPPIEALDEQERELARIVRALPGGEPPPALDARILKSAANAAASSRGPRARWLASAGALWGIGGAAAAVLALGVSWQMMYGVTRPQQPAASAVQAADESDDGSVAVEFKDGQPQAGSNAPAAEAVAAEPVAAPALAKPAQSRPRVASAIAPAAPPPAAAPVPVPVPEAFSDDLLDEHVARRAERGAGAETAMAAAAVDAEASAGSGNAAKAMAGTARERAATQARAVGVLSDATPAAAVPAGPMKPATWLAHVRRLRDQQRPAEARASLLEFQRRYPDFVIPSDLAPLLRQ